MTLLTPTWLACATCMADPGSDVSRASSSAIFFMVAVIAAVLGVLLKVILSFARKQRRFEQSQP